MRSHGNSRPASWPPRPYHASRPRRGWRGRRDHPGAGAADPAEDIVTDHPAFAIDDIDAVGVIARGVVVYSSVEQATSPSRHGSPPCAALPLISCCPCPGRGCDVMITTPGACSRPGPERRGSPPVRSSDPRTSPRRARRDRRHVLSHAATADNDLGAISALASEEQSRYGEIDLVPRQAIVPVLK